MATSGEIPRVPDIEDAERHRRAHDRISDILNDLIRTGVLVRDGSGHFTVSPSGSTVLGGQVFGQNVMPTQLPDTSNAFPILASRVFADRVSYGTVG